MLLSKKKTKVLRSIIQNTSNRLDTLDVKIISLQNELFAMKNEPRYKPFDEVYIITYNINDYAHKKQIGIIVTDAIVQNNNYIYSVKIDNKIYIKLETELMHPSDV